MKKPALADFKQHSRDIAPAARAVLMARAHAELTRERVDAYIQPIFESFNFHYSGELAEKCKLSGPLPARKDLYLCGDDVKVRAYFDACDLAHRERGFTGPKDHCPALIAENLQMETERAFLKLASPLFGVEFEDTYGEQRVKALDLLIGACIKAEGERARLGEKLNVL
jgi:hypothetical protein